MPVGGAFTTQQAKADTGAGSFDVRHALANPGVDTLRVQSAMANGGTAVSEPAHDVLLLRLPSVVQVHRSCASSRSIVLSFDSGIMDFVGYALGH
ncbi:hypothetical protein ON010_g18752 [Phytophthora cinnamomi]|nr:hypothetical protein ON010_g18752 [Phytophthora cinnamomi]